MSNVRNYIDQELLDRVKSLSSFQRIPKEYWILGVQSDEDEPDVFDDKFYIFKGEEFYMVTTGTTNAGLSGLQNYEKYNKNGCAVIKTDEWYYGLWRYGLHRNKMPALKQIRPVKFYRDWNKNKKAEEYGKLYEDIIGINFHTVTYSNNLSIIKKLVGGWSVGCQVANNVKDYYDILKIVKEQPQITYCLLKEF